MEKIKYEIGVDADGAISSITELKDKFKEVNKEADKVGKDGTKSVDKLGKSANKSSKGVVLLKKGFKALGTAIKATGIGLVIAAVAALGDAFSRNKEVMDKVNIAFGTVQQVFSQVANVLIDVYKAVASSSENFDALGKVLSGLLTVTLKPFQFVFYAIKLGVQELSLAWEKSFLGNNDPESIKNLNAGIRETQKSIVETAEDIKNAGKDIVENFTEAVGEVGAIGEQVVEGMSKVSVKAAKEQATANKLAKDAGIIAQAQAARLVAQYERQAEQQRQLRDDISLSIEDRVKANDKLGKVLEEQEKQMLKQADAVIAAAKAEAQLNDSTENRANVIAAVAAKEQVLSDIEGKRSEQKVNAVNLEKEYIDLLISQNEASSTLSIQQKKFAAEQITDNKLRIAALLQVNEEERVAEIARLEEKRDNFKQGTQAYVDAQNELNAKKQEFKETEDTLNAEEKQRATDERQVQIDNQLLDFETRRNLLKEQRDAILADEALSEEERQKMLKANSIASIKIADEESKAKLAALDAVGNGLMAMSDLAGKETEAGKALAIAAATISTFTGIAAIWGNPSDVGPTPLQIAAKIAGTAAVAAGGFGAVKQIIATKVPNSPGGGGGATPQKPAAPTFNVVGQSPATQQGVAQGADRQIDNQINNPTKAYVVSTEITSQQALDRDVESQGELG